MNVFTFNSFHNYTKQLLQAVKEMFEKTLNANNRMYFLSDEDFNYMAAAKHSAEEGIGWKMLPVNIVFRVEKLTQIPTKWGLRHILHLRDAIGSGIKVWAPRNVVHDLKSGFKLTGEDCLAFIKSLGEKETDVLGEQRKKFFDFETVYIPDNSIDNNKNSLI